MQPKKKIFFLDKGIDGVLIKFKHNLKQGGGAKVLERSASGFKVISTDFFGARRDNS